MWQLMKRILILEDNENTSGSLEKAICETDRTVHIYKAADYEEACKIAFSRRIDVFLIDIILTTRYPGDISGVLFAQQVRKHEPYLFTPIIFITALADPKFHAYEEIHCYGYLEKPFSIEKAKELISQALKYEYADDKQEVLWFRKGGVLFAVRLQEIVYVEAKVRTLYIHTRNREVMEAPYLTIKKFLEMTAHGGFCQCSRNVVINRKYVKNIDTVNRYISMRYMDKRIEMGSAFRKQMAREHGYG